MKQLVSDLVRFIAKSRKAIIAAAGAGVSAAIPLASDGLSFTDALIIAGAVLGFGGLTYRVPNAK